MQYRIQFVRARPDGEVEAYPVDALLGFFPTVHEAAMKAEHRIKQAAGEGDVIASYIIVDESGRPVDPLGMPIS